MLSGKAFNRTILELKYTKKIYLNKPQQAFNRTILELKLYRNDFQIQADDLLIVPYWN